MAIVVLWHRRPFMFSKHTRGHKGFRSRIELSHWALNTPDERFDTERSTREDRLYILRGAGEKDAVCTRADCPSCIPSRLLGILSSYPLHALSRWFSPSFSFPSTTLSGLLFSVSLVRPRAVYRGEQYSSHLNILRAVSRVAIRMLCRCCRKS